MFRAESRQSKRALWAFALLMAAVCVFNAGGGWPGSQEPAGNAAAIQGPESSSQPAATQAAPRDPAVYYGNWVLLPPIATIVLAILFRQVIPALCIGILMAAYMMAPCLPPEDALGGGLFGGLRIAVERYAVGALASPDRDSFNHVKIIVFTMMIGGMVGIMAASGGTRAVVVHISRWASTPRRGQFATWLAGILVFFDDYANAMIVGPAMRPVTDRLRVSRAKLAYIVDSTAAPVASIALFGTWVGAEVGLIDKGLKGLEERPAFLQGVAAFEAFWQSIFYRYYAILALVMVLLIALTRRDFGPMRKAEQAAFDGEEPAVARSAAAEQEVPVGRAWYAVLPVLVLIGVAIGLLFTTGIAAVKAKGPPPAEWSDWLRDVLSNSDAYNSILYAALASLITAGLIALATRALTLAKTVDSATDVVSRMLPTFIILVLAWALSAAVQELKLAEVAQARLQAGGFAANWLPVLIFISAAVVSFATGTSWGTMGILCPATVQIAAGLLQDTQGMSDAEALSLFYASVGAVLSGAIFGDHCSPISDTTVLSSLASECTLEQHVWTQMPYALVVAVVSVLCGDALSSHFNLSPWIGICAGSAALLLILLAIGRPPQGIDASRYPAQG